MTQQSLYYSEEKAISEAEKLLADAAHEASIPTHAFRFLLKRYRKLFRQVVSLVKMGDRMQYDLNILNQRIKESEEKYRGIFENAVEGIYRADSEGCLTAANPALAWSLGYETPGELIAGVRSIAGGPLLHENRLEEFRQLLLTTGTVDSFQAQMIRKDGRCIWVEISARAVSDADGCIEYIEGLVSDVTERILLQEKLRRLATTDGLTGLANRRHFMETAKKEFARTQRQGSVLSIILFDIDHFKRVNDTYGHDAGDKVLKALADAGSELIRSYDTFCRFGGEEFATLLPGIDRKDATEIAERIRERLSQTTVAVDGGEVRFTISAGVGTLSPGTDCLETLIKQADVALYDAKTGGRNRVRAFANYPHPDRCDLPPAVYE
jgi:diguanylate cyclase (GGDEF)-like protein/PAS domain S-box-containing protein